MRLSEINTDQHPIRLVLDGLMPEPQLTRVVLRLRGTSPYDKPNGLIDEAFLGDMMHGMVMNLRGSLAGIPPAVLKDPTTGPQVQAMLQKAMAAPTNMLDPQMDNWWLQLGNAFVPKNDEGQPMINMRNFTDQVKKSVEQQAKDWIATNQNRQTANAVQASDDHGFNAELAQLKNVLKKRAAVQRLLARYGVNAGDLSDRQTDTAALQQAQAAGMPPAQAKASASAILQLLQFMATPEGQQALQKLQAAQTAKEDVARDIIIAMGGGYLPGALTEAPQWLKTAGRWLGNITGVRPAYYGAQAAQAGYRSGGLQAGTGGMLDLFSPERRASIGQGYVQRSQNKAIASMAIAAAAKLAASLQARFGGGAGGPSAKKTTLAGKPPAPLPRTSAGPAPKTTLAGGATNGRSKTALAPTGGKKTNMGAARP